MKPKNSEEMQVWMGLISPPGDTLVETLEFKGMSSTELGKQTGIPIEIINEIIQGNKAITLEIAMVFEQALDIPTRFWLEREKNYKKELGKC